MNESTIVKQNEKKVLPFVWIDGDEKEVMFTASLEGEGSAVQIAGIFLGTSNSTISFNTDVTHKGKNTFSRTDIRGVFLNNSSISNDGMIRIAKGAKGADGYFTSKILLFDNAKGISVPSLEIDENELKAGHASTIGRPDEEQLFYMQSRGLSEKEAQKLLIFGFFEPVLQLLPKELEDDTRERLKKYLS